MLREIITSDNSHLSQLKNGADDVTNYVRLSRAANTLKAYASDLESFRQWGGAIPSSPDEVAHYLADNAERLKPATLSRHLASIAVAHKAKGLASPGWRSRTTKPLRPR